MKFNLIFLPDFFNDLKQAVDWYDDQQTGLGIEFYLEVKKQILSLKTTALHFMIRYDDIRCMPMKKYPYMVHYYIDISEKKVIVTALFHTSRNLEK